MTVWLLLRMTLSSCDTLLLCCQKYCWRFKNKNDLKTKNAARKGRYTVRYLKLHRKASQRVRATIQHKSH